MIVSQPGPDHYDVVIVGSGPAGISTALEMAKSSSARIAVVESGLLERHPAVQKLSLVELEGDLIPDYFPIHTKRCFGGSSTVWGGFCAMLEERAFMAGAWPIPYSELSQWYQAAAAVLELPDNAYRRAEVPLGSSKIVYRPFYLSPPVRFNEKYHGFFLGHTSVHLILGKTCTRLETKNRTVTAVELRDSLKPESAPLRLTADAFVLACGGVGNPRMLQLSNLDGRMPVGLGLMEHPHLYGVARMYLNRERILDVAEKKAHVVHALQLSHAYCVAHGLVSLSADFNLHQVGREPLLGLRQKTTLTDVSIRAEIPPLSENRVSLGRSYDYLAQPATRVEFRFHCDALVRQSWGHFARALLTSGLGRPSDLVPKLEPASGGHLMGTTRMGLAETDSVVDGNCKVHTTDNLYIAGSSVFPAGGASNPTYTIVAMALRLGDHLARTLAGASYG